MTIRIMLACAGGMSTSLLATRMRKAAAELSLDITVGAMPVGNVTEVSADVDILLLGPQVRYQLDQVRAIYQGLPVTVRVIESLDYGRMLGGKVLEEALAVYEEEQLT